MGAVLFVQSDGRALWPLSKASALALDDLPKGVPLRVEPSQPRNVKQHRLFWAFATYVAAALNDGPTALAWDAERVVMHLKLATGHVELAKLAPKDAKRLGIDHVALPKSISFAAMDGTEFSRFMDQAFIHVRDQMAPWIMQSPNWREIKTILRESALLADPVQ